MAYLGCCLAFPLIWQLSRFNLKPSSCIVQTQFAVILFYKVVYLHIVVMVSCLNIVALRDYQGILLPKIVKIVPRLLKI